MHNICYGRFVYKSIKLTCRIWLTQYHHWFTFHSLYADSSIDTRQAPGRPTVLAAIASCSVSLIMRPSIQEAALRIAHCLSVPIPVSDPNSENPKLIRRWPVSQLTDGVDLRSKGQNQAIPTNGRNLETAARVACCWSHAKFR